MSDLHLEFETPRVRDPSWRETCALREATPGHPKLGPYLGDLGAVDLVVLAGDIWTGHKGEAYAGDVARFTGAEVVYVMGNHEGYQGKPFDFLADKMRRLAARTEGRVHILENESVVVKGVHVLGATLWTDFALDGEAFAPLAMIAARNQMNDYSRCRIGGRKLTPAAAQTLHFASRRWLGSEIGRIRIDEPEARIVVVTHHAPVLEAIPRDERGKPLAPAYASDLSPEIAEWKPTLWVSGHTHHALDMEFGDTRLLSAPRGYVGIEPAAAAFRPVVVEIDAPTLDDEPTGPRV